jgi:hypothetical protein
MGENAKPKAIRKAMGSLERLLTPKDMSTAMKYVSM